MPAGDSGETADGLLLTCPGCGARCRARAATSKTLRCPKCRGPLQSAAKRIPNDDEEEDSRPYAARAPAKVRAPEAPEPDPIEDVEVRRKRPPAPRAPLWLGVYSFPWSFSGLRAWFLFGIGFALVAFLAGAVHYVIDKDFGIQVLILFVQGMMAFLIWTGMYAGGFFLATIQETGAGNQEVRWPDDAFGEKLFTLLYVCWTFLLAVVPLAIIALPLQPVFGVLAAAASVSISAVCVFPVVLLCLLTNDSMWQAWNADVVGGLVWRPLVLLLLWVVTTLLLIPCVALGYLTIGRYSQFIFLAPVTGFVWSTCVLIYGRLLGRIAWVISGGHELSVRQARRRKKRKRTD